MKHDIISSDGDDVECSCGWQGTRTAMVEVVREPAGDRWCFECRKRLPHDDVLLREAEPGYYDPHWETRCSGCGKDRTDFPGTRF